MDQDYARIMRHIHTQHQRIEELERRVLDLGKRVKDLESPEPQGLPRYLQDPGD